MLSARESILFVELLDRELRVFIGQDSESAVSCHFERL